MSGVMQIHAALTIGRTNICVVGTLWVTESDTSPIKVALKSSIAQLTATMTLVACLKGTSETEEIMTAACMSECAQRTVRFKKHVERA